MDESLQLDQQQRWQRGDRVLVDAYLRQFPALGQDSAKLAELICGELALREAFGETPNLQEYLQRFPQCAEPLAKLLGNGHHSLETVMPEAPVATDPTLIVNAATITALPAPLPPPQQGTGFETIAAQPTGTLATASQVRHAGWPEIPGFEVLSELGRGGMGVVYKARQLAANRLVALKVVRRDVLESLPLASQSSTLGRFRHEAQAAARLQHDNLVTVYEVGEVHGQWYYAMRYVQGKSLHDMLRAGPLPNRRAAGYIEPVARGLAAAHEQGILHRDLKPHNIMVDERSDRPLLADFGLAKFVEGSDELTRAGEMMGTPSYMPPEQTLDAGKVTALADVYSLGATLYHVLTARPPFQAASLAETIHQINTDEPVAPRTLNPAIDRDLETVCLKCLQKEPARRYASAKDLADDLQRYLEGRPILARPLGPVDRMWRWCRRNPWLAGATASAAGLALIAVLAIVVGYVNTAAALAKSEVRLQKALSVVDELFTRLSEDELLNEPGMQPLRKDLLARALKHYQYFLDESGGNVAIRDEVAAARFRVGLITQLMGSREAALEDLSAARKMQEELLAGRPQDATRIKALADTLNALGSLHKEAGDFDQATASYTAAAAQRQRLTELDQTNHEYVRLLANTRMNLAVVEMKRDQFEAARRQMTQAQEARGKLLAAEPESAKVRRDLAMGSYNFATLALAAGAPDEAARHLNDAIGHFEKLLVKDERSLANRYYLSVCYRLLGGLQSQSGEVAAALNSYVAAEQRMRTLAVGNPEVALYQAELAMLAMNCGALYEEQNNLPAAKNAWSQAVHPLQELLRREPKNADYRRDLANTEWALGNFQLEEGDLAGATKTLTAARNRLQALADEFPSDASLAQQLADVAADLASAAQPPDKDR